MNAGSRISRIREGCGLCPTRHLCAARDLSDPALDALSESLTTTSPMGKGDFLYRTGDEAENWYVVRSGVFKTVTVTPDGEEYVTGFYYPGEILGLDGPATGTHGDTAVALGVSTACSLGLDKLPEIWGLGAGASLLRLIAERERNEAMLRVNLSQSRAEARIAGFLKLLMDRTERLGFDPKVLSMPMSRTDLANHLGLTLECVSRVLSKWRKAGVLDTDRTTMRIIEADALTTAAYHLAA
ncbi:MAG: cyclic nucleotide-binding domain-containing protein [Gammaproteobacteria bacterium]|nr:MAG: cyclic nucleotide-binding domain-containing protein [Gammaproteobacteria bacterium]